MSNYTSAVTSFPKCANQSFSCIFMMLPLNQSLYEWIVSTSLGLSWSCLSWVSGSVKGYKDEIKMSERWGPAWEWEVLSLGSIWNCHDSHQKKHKKNELINIIWINLQLKNIVMTPSAPSLFCLVLHYQVSWHDNFLFVTWCSSAHASFQCTHICLMY